MSHSILKKLTKRYEFDIGDLVCVTHDAMLIFGIPHPRQGEIVDIVVERARSSSGQHYYKLMGCSIWFADRHLELVRSKALLTSGSLDSGVDEGKHD